MIFVTAPAPNLINNRYLVSGFKRYVFSYTGALVCLIKFFSVDPYFAKFPLDPIRFPLDPIRFPLDPIKFPFEPKFLLAAKFPRDKDWDFEMLDFVKFEVLDIDSSFDSGIISGLTTDSSDICKQKRVRSRNLL